MSFAPIRSTSSPATHIDLVGLLFIVWGALTMLIGASTLALGIAAASLIRSAGRASGGQWAAGLTAVTFVMLALMALVWGLGHVIVGNRLRQFRQWSRLAALMFGSVDLFLLPYGTVLGVYSLWTLLREDAKPFFDSSPAS